MWLKVKNVASLYVNTGLVLQFSCKGTSIFGSLHFLGKKNTYVGREKARLFSNNVETQRSARKDVPFLYVKTWAKIYTRKASNKYCWLYWYKSIL